MSLAFSPITQKDRVLVLETPLGEEVLLLERCAGSDTISGMFSFELDLLADVQRQQDAAVVADKIVGQEVTIGVQLSSGERYFSGIVKRFTEGAKNPRFAHYRAEVVPWLWLLTLKVNCRIFQSLTTLDIVKKVFDELRADYGDVVSYRDATTSTYTKWDYCAQYHESDFNFVSRLMEQDGIFYFFEHQRGRHTLVLADANAAFNPVPQQQVRFEPEIGIGEREDTVVAFSMEQQIHPGKYTVRDHHFEMPSRSLERSEPTVFSNGNSNLEIYEYPGQYAQRPNMPDERLNELEPAAERMSQIRMQESELVHRVYTGNSLCRDFTSGSYFELTGHPKMNGKYLLASVQHVIAQTPSYISGHETTEAYGNSFVAVPFSTRFRPRRVTPKPIVQGPQTATVTVKSGEESWLDKYGRVRLQFHWDRLGQHNESSTCWVRVAQSLAGKNWGAHFWPRVEQEVVVEFLEGDPDRPLVTGSVYNSDQMPPYTLPQYYTRTGVKTRSSKNGSSSNFNEVRFEDKKDNEQVFIHAERDMDQRVKHDSREWIGNERHLIVKSNQKEMVEGDKHSRVEGNHSEQIGNNVSLTVGSSCAEKIGENYAVDSGQEIHLKAGMNVVIEAGMQLTIKAAGGFINIGPSGVAIQGTMVLINSGGAAGNGSGANPDSPSWPDQADDGTKGTKVA